MHFLLTASSRCKLKRSGVHLLADRPLHCNLCSLCYPDIEGFDLERYLLTGGLPQVYDSQWPQEELDACIKIYLKEESRWRPLCKTSPVSC